MWKLYSTRIRPASSNKLQVTIFRILGCLDNKRAAVESNGIAMGISGSELSQLSSARFDMSHVVWSNIIINMEYNKTFFIVARQRSFPMHFLDMLQRDHPICVHESTLGLSLSPSCFTCRISTFALVW